jgi:hypothetical protein
MERVRMLAYLYTRGFDGGEYIADEARVKSFLETVAARSGDYRVRAFERRAIKAGGKRSASLLHSFYVITDRNGVWRTLSFSGTSRWFFSQGAWTLDTVSDTGSYLGFLTGDNGWDVREIRHAGAGSLAAIDPYLTAVKILAKIAGGVTYYYNDHLDNKANRDNCNTALFETITWRE